jgi:PAS domain S-box-containing protein
MAAGKWHRAQQDIASGNKNGAFVHEGGPPEEGHLSQTWSSMPSPPGEPFHRLFVNLPIPAVVWRDTPSGIVLQTANRQAVAITGGKVREMIGQAAKALFGHAPDVLDALHRCLDERTTEHVAAELAFRQDQGPRQFELTYVFVPPDLALACGVDVTDFRHSEKELRNSEERYRAISELTTHYSYAFDVTEEGELRRAWATESFWEITGYTPEQLEARGGWPSLIHPKDLPRLTGRPERLLAGDSDVREFRIICRQGEVRWLRDFARGYRDEQAGRVTRIYGAAQDITSQREIQHALAVSEERRRLAMEGAHEGLWDWDVQAGTAFHSPVFYQMVGLDRPRQPAAYDEFLDHVHPEDRQQVRQSLHDHRDGRIDEEDVLFRMAGDDGRWVWIRRRGKTFRFDEANLPARIVGTHANVTEQIEAREQLEHERNALRDANAALRTLMQEAGRQKQQVARGIESNVEKILLPLLDSLLEDVPRAQRRHVELIRRNLEEIASPFVNRLSQAYEQLSPTEVQVCNMIRRGLASKEIARLLHISPVTVNHHRDHIRHKLGLVGKKANLQTFLNAMDR